MILRTMQRKSPDAAASGDGKNSMDYFVTRTMHSSTLPSTVAVMVVVPAATAFTTPLPETVAIPMFLRPR